MNKNFVLRKLENGKHCFRLEQDFSFKLGGKISVLELVYETFGTLSASKDNVILIHHALSPDSHVTSTEEDKTKGWWQDMVGPGCPIDTNHYFVICINNLGSCFGSSGPASINPETGKPYRSDFPIVTIEDMVHSQYLLLQALEIPKLKAVMGNSMGGMLSLVWAMQYPETLEKLVLISSCYKAYPANIANRLIQKEIIELDPDFKKGFYQHNPIRGFKIARKFGHITYRNTKALNEKFLHDKKRSFDQASEIETYLEYNATKFVEKFDCNSYLYLLRAMDLFDVTADYSDAKSAFSKVKVPTLVVSVSSDVLYTPEQQYELYQQLKNAEVDATLIQHHSDYGHDAFLVEIDAMGKYIRPFLK